MRGESIESENQQAITNKIGEAKLHHEKLKEKLAKVEIELTNITEQTSMYGQLLVLSDQLQQLYDTGNSKLFWEDKYANEAEFVEHIKTSRTKAKKFTDKVDIVREDKLDLEKQVTQAGHEVNFLIEDLKNAKISEDESKNDFVIVRDYETLPFHPDVMPWDKSGNDEKRFRKFLLLGLLYSILFILVVPHVQLPIPDKDEVVKVPERIVKFLKKKEPKPKPKPKKLAGKKKPTAKDKAKARKKVAKKGILAFKNNFADLMDNMSDVKLGANAKLSKQGKRASSTKRSLVLSQAQGGSGGINSSSLSRDVGIDGKLGAVGFARVKSAIGTGAEDDRPLNSGPGASRTDEEIQIVFDRYKAVLYRIYNRELRKNPTLRGKMVLRITILPSGKVLKAKVESTDLDSAMLSKKIIDRVLRFNFGAKKDVPTITILYPIDFLPAS